MNIQQIILWSAIAMATIALIVAFNVRTKTRNKRIFAGLAALAGEYGPKIQTYDHWSNTRIGMDLEAGGHLYFIRTAGEQNRNEVISLSNVNGVRLYKGDRVTKVNKESFYVIDKIEVILTLKNPAKQELRLEFYNSEYDHMTLSGELQLAEKWVGLIKSNIHPK